MPVTQTLGSGSTRVGVPRRTGLFIVVAALHVLIVYGLMVATGVVHQPAFVAPLEAVFIPEDDAAGAATGSEDQARDRAAGRHRRAAS